MMSKVFLPILFLGLMVSTAGFSQRIAKESLPEGFNCTACILVILKKEPAETSAADKKKYMHLNEIIAKDLVQNYEGKTLFITAADLHADKMYSDTTIYRFVLGIDIYKLNRRMPTKINKKKEQEYMESEQVALNCHMYDRLTKRGYPQMSTSPSGSKHLEAVAEALNKLLKQ